MKLPLNKVIEFDEIESDSMMSDVVYRSTVEIQFNSWYIVSDDICRHTKFITVCCFLILLVKSGMTVMICGVVRNMVRSA